jgi:acetyl-CoA acetyltransferase
MGMSAAAACQKLLDRKVLKADDIDLYEMNEAFASVVLAVMRELGVEENAPFEKTNMWGGAVALGHPLGQSGARLTITLNNQMKTDFPDAQRGVVMLCGGFGNGNAALWERV